MNRSAFQDAPDDIILARARKGNRAAQAEIYRIYADACWTLALRITTCPERARDVVQESFIRVFHNLKQFRGASPFGHWLKRIVANQAISLMRREPDWHSGEVPEVPVLTYPGQELDLQSALTRLKPADRAVIWLFDVEGYSHEEIAEITGSTSSATRSRLSRARAQLRAWLDDENEFPKVAKHG